MPTGLSSVSRSALWVRHRPTGQIGRVVESGTLWGTHVHRLWLPAADTMMRVAEDQVETLDSGGGRWTGWRMVAAAV